ncbi:MAG: TetR/AcrR family transcriptional regulator [Bacilli bacterium]|jgi:AcrR family transcriptional regulator|nr:TetR/AcrR family transcriptional regulator [Bacilli bacterium]
MPRTREQFSEMKDERRSAILKAALPLFSLGQKVTIDMIADKAKCSHGIVYHYYRNTDQILEKLLKSSTYVELRQLLFNVEGSSYEKIEHIISTLLDVSKDKFENVCYFNMIIRENDKTSLRFLLTKLIKDGQTANSIIGGDPNQLVDSVFLMLKGIYLTFLLEKHPDIKVPSCETVMQLLRKPTNFGHQIL